MSTTWIAMGIALSAVGGLIVTLALLNFLVGGVEFFIGKPKLKWLKSEKGANGVAFAYSWNSAKEPGRFDVFKVRLFNPFGIPKQIEVARSFEEANGSFARDLDMGPGLQSLLQAKGFSGALVEVELSASKDGLAYAYSMRGRDFLAKLQGAKTPFKEYVDKDSAPARVSAMEYGVIHRNTIADTVPGRGPALKVATNPDFAGAFQNVAAAGGGAAAPAAAAEANFSVTKVWIEPGCIVCNACEDICPEVFEVKSDTCIIRPGAPLDLGLRIQESAEACPVEVIKFNRA